MDVAGIAAQQAQLRANIALETIKQSADAQKALANVIQQAAENLPAPSGGRGGIVDISA